MLTELVLWSTVGSLLVAVGYSADTWQFWCFLGTYWCVGQLARMRGKVQGIIDYINMTEQEQHRLKRALKEAQEDSK